jgi:hypothetical protein
MKKRLIMGILAACIIGMAASGCAPAQKDSDGFGGSNSENTVENPNGSAGGSMNGGDDVESGGSVTPPDGNHLHEFSVTVVAPTCTEQGYTKQTCACGEVIYENYVSAAGHQWVWTEGEEATCIALGSATYTCAVCGESQKISVEMLEHNFEGDICLTCGNLRPTEGVAYLLAEDGSYYVVAGFTGDAVQDLVIAPTYLGLPVTEVATEAFSNCQSLQTVFIPTTVVKIGKSAFKGCTDLTLITFASVEGESWYGYLNGEKAMSFKATQNAVVAATSLKETFYYYTWHRE